MFICIAGVIGVGKTTVAQELGKLLGIQVIEETVENHPYLEDFYKAMEDWDGEKYDSYRSALTIVKMLRKSFEIQIHFLITRFHQHFESRFLPHCIADRSIYEDRIFAEMLFEQGKMTEDNFRRTYLPHFNLLIGLLGAPDLMIILQCSPETAKARAEARGRDMEKALPLEYHQDLGRHYAKWAENYDYGRKLVINTEDMDSAHVVNIIREHLEHCERTGKLIGGEVYLH